MPKYRNILGKDLIVLMKKYGFVEHARKGSHCTMKNATTNKRITVPVHPKPIGAGLLSAILKQADLPKKILD